MTQPQLRCTPIHELGHDIRELGFRYHMPNLHAAIGISQIKKIDEIRNSRQEFYMRYYNELSDLDWLLAPKGNFVDVNPFLYYTCFEW